MRKLNSTVRSALPLFALAVILGGCGTPSLVGQWETKDLLQGRATVQYDFQADGTFTSHIEISGNDAGAFPMSAVGKGTYKLEKGILTADVSDFKIEGMPEAVNKEVRRNMPRAGRRPISGAMQWQSPDTFVLIENVRGTTMLFQRVKKK